MRLGFVSAILRELNFEQVVDFAAQEGFSGVEMMCWPTGPAVRKYGGVTHVDARNLKASEAERLVSYAADKRVQITGLGCYQNPLSGDPEEARVAIDQVHHLINAADMMGVGVADTFMGKNQRLSREDNLALVSIIWPPILKHAQAKGVKIAIENCMMLFTCREAPGGQNLMTTPPIWRQVFEMFAEYSEVLGLEFDPSHFIWQLLDVNAAVNEFVARFWRVHAKDQLLDMARLADVGTTAYCLEYSRPVRPGKGNVQWKEFFRALVVGGFDGDVDIEIEDGNYEGSLDSRKRALTESRDFLKPLIELAEAAADK